MSKSVIAKRRCAHRLLWLYAVLSLFYTLQAQAGQVTLEWDPNIQSILGGYKLYYGKASGTYPFSKDVGNEIRHTLTGLQDGEKYYFAVKAYSIVGLIGGLIQSGFSNEVSATIPSPPTVPTAGFNANPTSGTAPLTVTFTDTSTGNITAWLWDFDDGPPRNAQNAAKTYTNPGSYTVRLTVTDTAGSSDTATKTISVAAPGAAPVANFSASPTSGPPPLEVTFTNSSTNATSYSWDFDGDGTIDSTAQNPSHTYYTVRTYTVSLRATGPGGTDTQNGYITASSGGGGGSEAGLVGAYSFEEASGTSVDDASGQDNTGTISGATRITQGRFGKALSFDRVNDWVTINDSASLDLTTDMTLEAWVYPTVNMTDWVDVVMKEAPNGAAYYLVANSDTSQPASGVTIGGEHIVRGGPSLIANTWAHLAATYDGTTQTLYVDGREVAERSQTGPIQTSIGALRIGGNSIWGEFFQGRIDEVRIYNRALNAAEIQSDMNTPIAPSAPPIRLVGTDTIGPATDSNPQGKAEAFETYPGTTITGLVTSFSVYVEAGSTATSLIAGLYTDKNGHPGDLLAQGTLPSPVAGDWNTVPLPAATAINADSTYWIAILSPSGVLRFRDQVWGGRPSETSAQSTLTNLPNTWTTGTVYDEGRLSAYGAGYE